MKKIALEIISPERLVLKDEADFIMVPAMAGECGILPGHTHMLTQLSTGALRYSNGDENKFFAVSGGFAEVHPTRVEVFAETAEMAEEIDSERARLALEKAKGEISKSANPQDQALAQAALRRALLRLRVSEGISRARKNRA